MILRLKPITSRTYENTPPSASVDPIVYRLSWPQIRDRMKAGEPLRWLPITDTPGKVFEGVERRMKPVETVTDWAVK